MTNKRSLAATMLAVAGMTATAAVAGSAPAAATPAANANAAVVHSSTQAPSQVAAYWTPARMLSAREAPVPQQRATATAATPQQTHSLGTKTASGSRPTIKVTASVTQQTVVPMATVSRSAVWTNHRVMPGTTVGKLYFTTASGNAECTASVINSNNHSMIWTAGHCTNDGNGHWYTNFQFVPGYYNGHQPLGAWVWKSASTASSYLNGANSDYDFAAITLWPTSGVKVADRTGWQGYTFNGGYTWNAYEFGYPYDTHPAGTGITGQQLRYCIGTTWRPGIWPFQPGQEAIHCDQGHGASGGPWLSDLQLARGWGYLVGNVSYHPSDSSDEERSPHFGDAAVNVWNAQTNM
jgi:hypothetical protein